jgi:alanine racemase
MYDSCIAEISTAALRGNIQAIRRRVGAVPLCPAVKADAYGHGLDHVLKVLAAEGVERIAVANFAEALAARSCGWHRPILCLGAPLGTDTHACGCCEPGCANPVSTDLRDKCGAAVSADVSVTISTAAEARLLAAEAAKLHRPARVEIKIDSGMGRMGIRCEDAVDTIGAISRCPGVIIEGVYTHLATADEPDADFAHEQLARFLRLREQIRSLDLPVRMFHAANSAACFRLPEASEGLDLVRPGICLYGYWDGPPTERPADLTPAMRVVSRIFAVRRLPAGHSVGYGRSFITRRPSVIGVVPIGYADGYRRLLSNDAFMTLPPAREQPRRTVPVVGRISMDQTTIDLTEAGDVRAGDPVTVVDDEPSAPNSVEAIARKLGTITYEVTCLVGRRVRRVAT